MRSLGAYDVASTRREVYLVKTWEFLGYDEHEVVVVVFLDRERALRFVKENKNHFVEEWTIDVINSGVRIGSGVAI